jgi:hypothetical protein
MWISGQVATVNSYNEFAVSCLRLLRNALRYSFSLRPEASIATVALGNHPYWLFRQTHYEPDPEEQNAQRTFYV